MNSKVKQWIDFLQSIGLVGLIAYQTAIASGVSAPVARMTAYIAALSAIKGHFSDSPMDKPEVNVVVAKPTPSTT